MKYLPYILPAFKHVIYIKKRRIMPADGSKGESEPFDWGDSIEAMLNHRWPILAAIVAIILICILIYIFHQFLREIPNWIYVLAFFIFGLTIVTCCIILS